MIKNKTVQFWERQDRQNMYRSKHEQISTHKPNFCLLVENEETDIFHFVYIRSINRPL